jgi:hypothetical protein
MKETLQHKEAFEYYYTLGDKRSYTQVGQKFDVSKNSVYQWAKAFNWQQRAEQRDIELSRQLEKKTNANILNTKGDYRADIKQQINLLKVILNKAIKKVKDKDGNFIEVETINDLKDVINSYDKLSRLDLNMMGEADQPEEVNIKFKDI